MNLRLVLELQAPGPADAGGAEHGRSWPAPQGLVIDVPRLARELGCACGRNGGGAPRRPCAAAAADPGVRSPPRRRRALPPRGATRCSCSTRCGASWLRVLPGALPSRALPHAHRRGGDAPGGGPAAAGAAAVPDVPGGVCLVRSADGCDQGRDGRLRRLDAVPHGRRPAAQPAGRWRHCRRRRRARVPAADPDPVLFHPAARGFGLPAARRLPAGQPDGPRRPVGACLHPAAFQLCLCGAGHHGHTHHRQLARPAGHDHGRAADDLLGTAAGVRAADRGLCAGRSGRCLQPARV